MGKLRLFLFILILSGFFFRGNSVFAQEIQNQALFGELQRELAGPPDTWKYRRLDENNNNTLVPVPLTPDQVIDRENRHRLIIADEILDTDSKEIEANIKRFTLKKLLSEDSNLGGVFRSMANVDFFGGSAYFRTAETTELAKIRHLYQQVVNRVTRFGMPKGGNTLSACLNTGVGECRHMATLLHGSLKQAGIRSELVNSPTHVWNRITLSDPAYNGLTFDLDPTWYQQPIPLAPRSRTAIPDSWRELMTAITVAPTTTQFDLNGLWKSNSGDTISVSHTGNSIVATIKKSEDSYWQGKVTFSGTINGNKFTGNKLWRAVDCPNLDKSSPATGSVSSGSISVTSRGFSFHSSDCTFDSEGAEKVYALTRITPEKTQSPLPSPLPSLDITPTSPVFNQERTTVGDIPQVEAFVDRRPTDEDLPQPIPQAAAKDWFPVQKYVTAADLPEISLLVFQLEGTGKVTLEFPDGTTRILTKVDEQRDLGNILRSDNISNRDIAQIHDALPGKVIRIPQGTKIITEPLSRVQISALPGPNIYIEESSSVEFKAVTPRSSGTQAIPVALPGLEVQQGFVRFKSHTSTVRSSSATGYSPTLKGTDYAIAFDPVTKLSVIELYDGELDLGISQGVSKSMATSYGNEIKRLEIGKQGTVVEQIAIPKDEWELEKRNFRPKNNLLQFIFPAIVIIGLLIFLSKKGKLAPVYKKFSEIFKKNKKE